MKSLAPGKVWLIKNLIHSCDWHSSGKGLILSLTNRIEITPTGSTGILKGNLILLRKNSELQKPGSYLENVSKIKFWSNVFILITDKKFKSVNREFSVFWHIF